MPVAHCSAQVGRRLHTTTSLGTLHVFRSFASRRRLSRRRASRASRGGRSRHRAELEHVSRDGLAIGAPPGEARLIGAYDHRYDDNYAGVAGVGTHSSCWLSDLGELPLSQHRAYRWFPVATLLEAADIHPTSKPILPRVASEQSARLRADSHRRASGGNASCMTSSGEFLSDTKPCPSHLSPGRSLAGCRRSPQQRGMPVRKLRRLPWRLPKQNGGLDGPAPVERERDEPIERPALMQPVAYIAGRYVYSHTPSRDHSSGPRSAVFVRHRGSRAA